MYIYLMTLNILPNSLWVIILSPAHDIDTACDAGSVSREILSVVPRISLSFGFSLTGESSIIRDDDATGGVGAAFGWLIVTSLVSDCEF